MTRIHQRSIKRIHVKWCFLFIASAVMLITLCNKLNANTRTGNILICLSIMRDCRQSIAKKMKSKTS